MLTQLDKLILSHVLSLKEYGYFALVIVVTNGLLSLSAPISQAIMPRMTALLSQGDEAAFLSLYRKATRFVAALIFPITGIIALFSSELLYAWTGKKAAAEWGGSVLSWFALGNGILIIGGFQYILQYAHGSLKLHVIISTINTIFQVPVLAYAAFEYGALGAAIAWFMLRLLAFLVWPMVVHTRLFAGLHKKWILNDIIPVLLMTVALLSFISCFEVEVEFLSKAEILFALLVIVACSLILNTLVLIFCGRDNFDIRKRVFFEF
ncbi:MAG: oligosaccharide flippase family protein [Planctomycetes bacterium]|nr:oligosaccharide flippase family protein [Planctomycetota bacterium]